MPPRRTRDGHPRRVVLAGQTVEYRLIRAQRRTIGMEVDLTGLSVRAPRWVTLSEIEEALVERANWIVKALAEWRAPPARRHAARVEVAARRSSIAAASWRSTSILRGARASRRISSI